MTALAFPIAIICLASFQYGYHISALNSIHGALTCLDRSGPVDSAVDWLPTCIPMTNVEFGIITSAYTLGGLIGSLLAGKLANSHGRKRSTVYAALFVIVGSLPMTLPISVWMIAFGRVLVGVGCGMSTVLVPMYLSEIAPSKMKGKIGIMTQLSIVLGIFAAQALSLPFVGPGQWRYIPFISGIIALIQILLMASVAESPKWQAQQDELARKTSSTLIGPQASDPLLGEQDALEGAKPDRYVPLSVPELLKSGEPAVRNGKWFVAFISAGQQVSGVNAVLYYSTSILMTVMPTNAKYIALLVTAVNVLMTFPSIVLIDNMGRKPLFLLSSIGMCISSLVLAMAINHSLSAFASIFIITFVSSFAIGLGPLLFILVGEVVPEHASAAATSFGLAVNWTSNALIGLTFLPLRDALSGSAGGGPGTGNGQGNVFFIFTGTMLILTLGVARWYHPDSTEI
ncbi:uncharacterized protein L969DRAFT_88594 [Mixia osmundae IAM 14324]|uniref:Major facilitator superfamily (MFS) profile domain-containing protein n=1 Tax=Mixia osmundae (strain CBS 9802 / IAM 14324 / JCM 22182 / KY 12970) TaxID=764103 RepID=G7E6N4_MIXOS|nr:uncharacterized protein L969DRAFT_88594 [Mixia osmundae IAM 14324]KEI39126.1 hypothetical protein L969DRAFT_88594 [Mixia osmundae IAM 14324]GAA98494.1 hypothetical protein E5Q_05180 [Mixia osmundae IAM 14324]